MIKRFFGTMFPHTYRSGIIIASVFFICGIAIIGAYATAVDYTNSTEFCAFQCHEMQKPYNEYIQTKHYKNDFGVRAECPDCHVAHQRWRFTMYAKALATNDLFQHYFGHYAGKDPDTTFEAGREEMAKHVQARMKESDSRECRNCHSFEAMDLDAQPGMAKRKHSAAMENGKTCVDCHQGITHHLPEGMAEK